MNTTAPTGRDGQQSILSRCLEYLVGGSAPPHDVVLLGPRGNGKTALLHWFRIACSTASVDVVTLTPQRIPNHEALAPRRGITKWLPRKVGVGSLGPAEWQLEGAAHKGLTQALMAAVDEAGLAATMRNVQAEFHWFVRGSGSRTGAGSCRTLVGRLRAAAASPKKPYKQNHCSVHKKLILKCICSCVPLRPETGNHRTANATPDAAATPMSAKRRRPIGMGFGHHHQRSCSSVGSTVSCLVSSVYRM